MEAAEFRERLLDHLRLTAEPDRVYRTDEPWAIGPAGPDRGDPNLSFALPHAEALANALADGIPDHQGTIISFYNPTLSIPQNPALFDRYIAVSDGSGWTANHIYEWSGAIWIDTAPRPGMFRWIDDELDFYGFNGTEWYAVSASTAPPKPHELTGDLHTVSGTPGHVLRLVTSESAAFEAITAVDIGADAAGTAQAAISNHLNAFDHNRFLSQLPPHGHDWSDLSGIPSSFTPASHALLSHTAAGLTAGHFLKALGDTTYGFAAHGLTYTDVGAAAASHTHDDRYYTESETDTLLSSKQPADATLTALAGLNSTAGFVYQTGADVFAKYPFGTAANTVCQGNDSRLSDARTPTLHAVSHRYGGSDEVFNQNLDVGSRPVFASLSISSGDIPYVEMRTNVPNYKMGILWGTLTTNQACFEYNRVTHELEFFDSSISYGEGAYGGTIYHTGNLDPADFSLTTHTHDDRYYTESETDTLLSSKQPADATLTALAGLNSTAGFVYQTGADVFAKYPFGTAANTVCQGNDSRLSDARVPINNDYYVQGSSSTRTTDAGSTDVNSYSKSGFYKATSTALNLPDAFNGYGIIHTNYTSNQYAFQLASRWNHNKLYYRRQNSGTWFPWVELYHTGNFDPSTKQPADATLTALAGLNTTAGFLYQTGSDAFTKYKFGTAANTVCEGNDPRLSDARVPINNDYYVQGSSSTRTTDAGTTDLDSYWKSGFYKATTNAANTPTTGAGYGIIHTNYINDQYAFQLASRWDTNRLYYRRQNSGTWFPWVELYHTGNFDPNDYTTTAQLQDWSTNIMANQLGSYNAAEFTTVYNDYCDNIRLIKKGLTSLKNGYAGSIAFGARGANTRHAAIAAKQTGSDANQVGLAFFTHAETSISTLYPMVEKMVLDHNGTLSVGASLSSPLDLSADVSGNATISVPSVNNTITIRSGATNALVINANSTSTLQSRSIKLDAWQGVILGSDGSAFYKIYKITGTFENGSVSSYGYYNDVSITVSSGASPTIIGGRFKNIPNADLWHMICSGSIIRVCNYNETTSKIEFVFDSYAVTDGCIYEIWILES